MKQDTKISFHLNREKTSVSNRKWRKLGDIPIKNIFGKYLQIWKSYLRGRREQNNTPQAPCPACKNEGKQVCLSDISSRLHGRILKAHTPVRSGEPPQRLTCLHMNVTIKSCPKLLRCVYEHNRHPETSTSVFPSLHGFVTVYPGASLNVRVGSPKKSFPFSGRSPKPPHASHTLISWY